MDTLKAKAEICQQKADFFKSILEDARQSLADREAMQLTELVQQSRGKIAALEFVVEHLEAIAGIYNPRPIASDNSSLDPQKPEHDLAKIMPNEIQH